MQESEAAQALQQVQDKWEAAPRHVKAMAGPYVEPMIEVLDALVREQQQMREVLTRRQ